MSIKEDFMKRKAQLQLEFDQPVEVSKSAMASIVGVPEATLPQRMGRFKVRNEAGVPMIQLNSFGTKTFAIPETELKDASSYFSALISHQEPGNFKGFGF